MVRLRESLDQRWSEWKRVENAVTRTLAGRNVLRVSGPRTPTDYDASYQNGAFIRADERCRRSKRGSPAFAWGSWRRMSGRPFCKLGMSGCIREQRSLLLTGAVKAAGPHSNFLSCSPRLGRRSMSRSDGRSGGHATSCARMAREHVS